MLEEIVEFVHSTRLIRLTDKNEYFNIKREFISNLLEDYDLFEELKHPRAVIMQWIQDEEMAQS